MIILRKCQLLMVLLVANAFVFSAICEEQSKPAKRQLKFETSTSRIRISYPLSEAKYVCYFHVKEDRSLQPWGGSLQTMSEWKEMSEEQRQFIHKLFNEYQYKRYMRNKHIGSPFSIKSQYVRTPVGTRTYQVFGVTEEDVRKMVEAVLEWLDKQAHEVIETNKKTLDTNRQVIAEAEKILPKLEKECKHLEAQADKKTKEYAKTNYEIDSIGRKEIPEHARKKMEELARYLRLADFELIGLQARIDSIERFKAVGNISDQGTLIKLDQMLIADEIERAGVLARRRAYEGAFKQTKDLYDIIMSSNDAAAQKLGWEMKLADAQRAVPELEEWLLNPPNSTRPVEVHENKVIIHPVLPSK